MRVDDDAALTHFALRAADGDAAAARMLVRATQHQVWRFLVHLSDRTVAEDLAQETYLRAFAALPRYRAEASARTWLLAIARRVAADHLRSQRSRPRLALCDDNWQRAAERAQPPQPGAEENLALRQALADLAPDRREAFVLTQVIGLSYAEAAGICDCPVGTIRSRLARARDDLRTVLRAVHDQPHSQQTR
ncbi:MAG: sigma-70 family RNA polymerase sigma factor [Actinomycetota bacterium]|jgi:RNA polymerase sigma-70 factor (ECF subfamily)|nr:sigma-70 family RNA polymerase sigma factor [Actinomycetota bacterium]HYZ10119.1 sigma-70 family RNA polymerase sigma factor [Pseudonocardiaceae bacterium]